jgi:hypothetical protein
VQSAAIERLQSAAAKSMQSADGGIKHVDESRCNDDQAR